MRRFSFQKFALTVSLFFTTYVYGQSFSEAQLLEKTLYVTKNVALKNTSDVYRLRLYDYTCADYTILQKFPNLSVLSFCESSKVDVIPLGFKKLVNLTYLDISETQIKMVSAFTKKNKKLKIVYAKSGQLDNLEKKALAKRGIKVIDNSAEYPLVFVKLDKTELPIDKPIENTIITNSNSNSNNNNNLDFKAVFKDNNGKLVYNPDNVIIEEKNVWYADIDGKKVIYKKSPQSGLFNLKGELVAFLPISISVPAEFEFTEGYIPYKVLETGKLGYIDTTGKIVISAQFDKVNSFKKGKAIVELAGKKSYIDKTGKIIFTGDFEEIVPFYHPNFAVISLNKDTLYTIIDKNGNIVSQNRFSKYDFKYLGEIAIKEAFEADRIKSWENHHFGFKNVKGEWAIKPIYQSVSTFTGGLSTVCFNSKEKIGSDGYIVPDTNMLSGNDELFGVIDSKGNYIFPLKFKGLSEPWHNHFEDEITISGELEGVGHAIYDRNGKIIYGPLKNYKGKPIYRLEPFKNDHFVIEYYSGKKIESRHISDFGTSSYCDILHKSGKVVVSEHEYICQSVDENGYYCYTNFVDIIKIVMSEGKIVDDSPKASGVGHINGTTLFHQTNGSMNKDYSSYNYWEFRENPKDANKEGNASVYYENLKSTGKLIDSLGFIKFYEQIKIACFDATGRDITNVFKNNTLKIFPKTNGDVRNGKDVIRFNHYDSQNKFAGTALYSISLDKLIYVDYTKTTIGNFSENRFYVPMIGYIVEKAK